MADAALDQPVRHRRTSLDTALSLSLAALSHGNPLPYAPEGEHQPRLQGPESGQVGR